MTQQRTLLLAALGLSSAGLSLAQRECNGPNCPKDEDEIKDMITFPAFSEVAVVFPRNETYAVEAPFPVIFGIQNPAALLNFDTWLRWSLECENSTLSGGETVSLNKRGPVSSDERPHFIHVKSENSLPSDVHPDRCTLQYKVGFNTSCELDDDDNINVVTLENTRNEQASGEVTFRLSPAEEESFMDKLEAYEGCAVAASGIEIRANATNSQVTGCPGLVDEDSLSESPDACRLDAEDKMSDLIKGVATPETSAPAATATGNADDDDDDDDDNAAESGDAESSGAPAPSAGAGGDDDDEDGDDDAESGALPHVKGGSITMLAGAVAAAAVLYL